MPTYTVIAYIVPAGGHHIEEVEAATATEAAVAVRTKLTLAQREFEVIAVTAGSLSFEAVDHRQVALAPFSPSSP